MSYFQRNIGSLIEPIKGYSPRSMSAGTQNGNTIDLLSYGFPQSCVLFAMVGAATGTPAAQTYDVKLQHSDDGSSWQDLDGAALASITADNATAKRDIDLSTAKRYVRTHETMAFTAGTTPAWIIGCIVILGGSARPAI